jgi:hypothetical protein
MEIPAEVDPIPYTQKPILEPYVNSNSRQSSQIQSPIQNKTSGSGIQNGDSGNKKAHLHTRKPFVFGKSLHAG